MPGLIGSQGVRPGALNMNRVFRALRYRSEQAQYVTYHRPTIYKTDNYGVPSGTIGSQEILLPDLPAIIRPSITADYSEEKLGSNIIGAARVYTPNITTIKNIPNFEKRFLISKLFLFINEVLSSLTPTTFFIFIFFSSQKLKRSLIVHICKLGVLYQVFGRVLVTGIWPKNKSFVLTFQYPKFGIEIITDFPILKSSFNTFSGL